MSILAAAALSSLSSAQNPSSGTAAALDLSAVSTSAPTTGGILPGLTPGSSTTTAPAAEPSLAPGIVPRPWVIGEIKAEGLKNVKMSVIRGQIKARKGDLYDRPDLDRDIQSLLGLGEFERVGAELTLMDKPVPDNFRKIAGTDRQVILTFTVKEKAIIKKIEFENTIPKKKLSLSKGTLTDEISAKTSDPYDRFKLDEDVRKLDAKYREKGYLDASVELSVAIDSATAKAVVTFHVTEGVRSKIDLVEISGTHALKSRKLLGLMKNKRKKVFVESSLADDLRAIETEYKNNGYLDVRVSTPLVTLSPDKSRISIAVGVSEGRPYRFGATTFNGYIVFKASEVVKTIDYKQGKIFNQEKYEDTMRGVQELYADVGRLRTRVNPTKTYNSKTDQMDVSFDIVEGPVSYLDHVDVDGNKATKTYVIKREVVVKPGDRFSASRVRKSREKIMNLGFMDGVDVDLQPSPVDPDKVDVTFDVTEGKPGVLTAGAAYSSIDGLIGTMSLQHLNLFGRAQRGSLQWSFGKRVQDYSASWTTPWLGDHPTSLGFDVFHTRRINPFQGDISAYTERRTGGSIRLGPRFQEDRYQLNFTYTLQRVTIGNIDPNHDFGGLLTEGASIQSLLGAELARDTRDSIWDPTRGQRHAIGATLSGGPLMGDIHYFKPSLSNQAHATIFTVDDWPFVLSFYHRAAYITPFGKSKTVAVQDRFYIGGQDSLRGYSPSGEAGWPNGGTIYSVANVEFGFPLAREKRKTIVKFVLFADGGGSWNNARDISGRVSSEVRDLKTDIGFGLRFVTPAFPIRLDYGYGLNHPSGQKNYQINFGLGPLF